MEVAFVDTSYLVAVTLREAGWKRLRTLLRPYDVLVASELLAAELLAVLRREQIPAQQAGAALAAIRWVYPDRALRPEIERILEHGYVRGADLWHLACACYFAPDPAELPFLSRDARQREVASALGFPTP